MPESTEAPPPKSLLDAGPCITFCAVNKESLLHDVLAAQYSLLTPDVVDDEIMRKKGRGFEAVASGWKRLVDHDRVIVLPSLAKDADLAKEVRRLSGMPLAERLKHPKDLGELLAIAHGCMMKSRGEDVILLIDDSDGTKLARINGLRTISTQQVLKWAIMMGLFEDRGELKALYARMRPLDQSLVPIEQTELLKKDVWAKGREARENQSRKL